MSSKRLFSSWWKGGLGTLFTNGAGSGKSSFSGHSHIFTFKCRFFHSYGVRPHARNASVPRFKAGSRQNGWSVYEDLKLLSYGSHMIFFLLLPPVFKMLTTKVDVVKDDELGDLFVEDSILGYGTRRSLALSSGSCMTTFDSQLVDIYAEKRQTLTQRLEKRIADLRRNVQKSLKEQQTEKKMVGKSEPKFAEISVSAAKKTDLPTTPAGLMKCLGISISGNTETVESALEAAHGECFEVYESEMRKLFDLVTLRKIPEEKYVQSMEYIVDRIPFISGLSDLEVVKLYKGAFSYIHKLGLSHLEQKLVKKAINSTLPNDSEHKMLEVTARFTRERKLRVQRRYGYKIRRLAPLSSTQQSWQDGKSILRSEWIKYMLEDPEMYVALTEFASTNGLSVEFVKNLAKMFTAETESGNRFKQQALKVAVRKLIEMHKQKEANAVLRQYEQLYGMDKDFTKSLDFGFVGTALSAGN